MSEKTKSKEGYSQQSQVIKIGGDYILKHCFYRGKTHNIYLAYNIVKKDDYSVIRLVRKINQTNANIDLIYSEEKTLKKLNGIPGVPKLIARGEERLLLSTYHYSIFDKYGPSLNLCFDFMNRSFQIQTICMIAIQMLNVLERIHAKNLVHRNLKPKKILTLDTRVSGSTKNDLVLIDYKYAQKYKRKNGKFISQSDSKNIHSKTLINKYSSINTHLGLASSPKDDLESLGYILVHFLKKGKLFQFPLIKTKEEKMNKRRDYKMQLIPEKQFKDLPYEIVLYFQYLKMTDLTQFPFQDYEFLKKLFRGLLQKLNANESLQYEWITKLRIINNSEHQNNQEDQQQNQNSPKPKHYAQTIQENQGEEDKGTLHFKKINNEVSKSITLEFYDDEEDPDDTVEVRMMDFQEIQPKFKDYYK